MAKSKGMFTGSIATTNHRVESQEQIDTAYAIGRYAKSHSLARTETADLLQMMGVDSEPIVASALTRHGLVAGEPVALG